MEANEKKEEGKSCCATKCCCKATAAIVLLLVGAIGGYFAGRHCKACAMPAAPAASAPAQTPAK